MVLSITDFAGKDGMLDVPRLMALDDRQFSDALLEESRRYIQNHGRAVCCWKCDRQVLMPEDLVRHFRTNLHYSCFAEIYNKDRGTCHYSDREREYFDRLRKVVESRLRQENPLKF